MKEKINIDPVILYKLIMGWQKQPHDGYRVIEDKITSSDMEDGGANHTFVIERIEDNKFFKGHYCDWDIDNTDYIEEDDTIGNRCDLNTLLVEVVAKQVMTTIYE